MKDSKKILNFIIIGPPGSGKGTQAKLLLKQFGNLYYISTGDLFRKLSATKSDTGKRVKKIVYSGGLPMDEIAITLWMHEIIFKVKENQGILGDGFPRRISEAKSINKLLEFLGRKKNTCFFLIDISEKESYRRLVRRVDAATGKEIKRADDEKKDIKLRWKLYRQRTVPAIKYLKKNCRLIRINGEQPIEKVFKDILKTIKRK
ncbi:MAG: adenylate kinase [Candidatus Portnoybacteria bacterium CG10_big_fil_rev_8_21_14_0_10_38_18]|uniref:Adenylate kinase n=1 Tax=Candidatus Portnoybacteria bacterium CG10_big_fil_rev_8_21_14_0_10_38_18 TaxID=1974813 RepID=A0A2M8KCD6_9BACT|nr:MAG: adenylate kinase [Candidatus Portnoybacteria bacterium CG10_big_fil_rev_8_21_14_0_10_38_18]